MLRASFFCPAAQPPSAAAAEQLPTAPLASADPKPEVPPVAIRLGEYEVGGGFYPHLSGHPNMRY